MQSNDFFVIGAQKAATTTVHDYLVRAGVCLPERKETKFFADDRIYGSGNIEYYERNFQCRDVGGRLTKGEVDPDYIYFEKAASRIYEYSPNAKIVVVLRDPIARAISHYKMSVRIGVEKLSFEDALKAEVERLSDGWDNQLWYSYLDRGRYHKQLSRYWKLFPKESIIILNYEELIAAPEIEMQKILRFIGFDSSASQIDFVKQNEAYSVRSPFLARILSFETWIKSEWLRNVVRVLFWKNSPQRRLAEKIKTYNKQPPLQFELTDSARNLLLEGLKEDVELLAATCNAGYAKWLTP